MNKIIIILLYSILLFYGCNTKIDGQKNKNSENTKKLYENKKFAIEPKLFSKEILSKTVESSLTINPTGQELFFVKKDSFYSFKSKSTIYTSKFINGKWSLPQIAAFSGKYSDTGPFISPDGKLLFFTSNRTVDDKIKKDKDIWVLEKKGNKWSNPKRVPNVNSDKSEYSPSIDNKGNLYFGSYRKGGKGSGDVWVSYKDNNNYTTPINLGNAINSSGGEWGSCISPDGEYIIFEASGREENISYDGDLFISHHINGQWVKAKHLGKLNSGGSDLSPKIHGKYLYFASNRHKERVIEQNNNNVDIYYIELKGLLVD